MCASANATVAVVHVCILFFFFFNDTATTEIYTLSLHDALPISVVAVSFEGANGTVWTPIYSFYAGTGVAILEHEDRPTGTILRAVVAGLANVRIRVST